MSIPFILLKDKEEQEKIRPSPNFYELRHMHHLIKSASTRWFCWHDGRTILAIIRGYMYRLNVKTLFYTLGRVSHNHFFIFNIAKKNTLIHIVYNKKSQWKVQIPHNSFKFFDIKRIVVITLFIKKKQNW